MERLDVRPDAALLGAFSAAAAEAMDADLATKLFAFVDQPASRSNVEASFYGQLVKAFVLAGRLDDALKVLEFTHRSQIQCTGHPYSMLLSACARDTRSDLGRRVHELYRRSGLHDLHVENALIHMYGQMGDIDSAFAAYEAFCGSAAGTPDLGLFMSLVQVCLTCLIDSPLLELTLIPGMSTCELTIACIASVVGNGAT